jgi:hypothetical protein
MDHIKALDAVREFGTRRIAALAADRHQAEVSP